MNSKYISDKFRDELRDNLDWEVNAIKKRIQRELGAEVSIHSCYRAKRKAKKFILGDLKQQYTRLHDYAATIKTTNPRSCVKIECATILKHIYEASIAVKNVTEEQDEYSVRNLVPMF